MNFELLLKRALIAGTLIISMNSAKAQYNADTLYTFYSGIFNQHDKKLHDFLIDKLDQYVQNFPTNTYAADATYLLGKVYEEKGKKYHALANYFKTMFLYPENIKGKEYANLTVEFIKKENMFKDKQEKLIAILNGDFPINTVADRYDSYLTFLMDLNEPNLYEFAQLEISHFISQFPEHTHLDKILQWDADVYAKRGKAYEAVASYLQLGALFPDSPLIPYAHLNRGILLNEKLDKQEDAIRAFTEVVSNYPTSEYAGESLFQSGEIKEKKLKNYEGAVADYRKLITTYPEHKRSVYALLAIAKIYSKNLKKYTDAIAAYEEVVDKYRTSPLGVDALEEIGNIYFDQLKDYGKAAEYYAKVAEIHPASDQAPEMLLKAGSVCEDKLQDYQKAIDYYQLVVDKYSNHKKAGDAAKRIEKCNNKMSK